MPSRGHERHVADRCGTSVWGDAVSRRGGERRPAYSPPRRRGSADPVGSGSPGFAHAVANSRPVYSPPWSVWKTTHGRRRRRGPRPPGRGAGADRRRRASAAWSPIPRPAVGQEDLVVVSLQRPPHDVRAARLHLRATQGQGRLRDEPDGVMSLRCAPRRPEIRPARKNRPDRADRPGQERAGWARCQTRSRPTRPTSIRSSRLRSLTRPACGRWSTRAASASAPGRRGRTSCSRSTTTVRCSTSGCASTSVTGSRRARSSAARSPSGCSCSSCRCCCSSSACSGSSPRGRSPTTSTLPPASPARSPRRSTPR